MLVEDISCAANNVMSSQVSFLWLGVIMARVTIKAIKIKNKLLSHCLSSLPLNQFETTAGLL